MMRVAQGLVLAPSLEAFFERFVLEPELRIKAVVVDGVFECDRMQSDATRQARQEVFGDTEEDTIDDLFRIDPSRSACGFVIKLRKPKVIRIEKLNDVSGIERAAVEKVSAKLKKCGFHRWKSEEISASPFPPLPEHFARWRLVLPCQNVRWRYNGARYFILSMEAPQRSVWATYSGTSSTFPIDRDFPWWGSLFVRFRKSDRWK